METWSDAMTAALYGPDGFYRTSSPDAHFRTSVSASPLLAASVLSLVVAVDEALGCPTRLDIVDIGAGDGALLGGLLKELPSGLADRFNLVAVEIRPRPDDLPPPVNWTEVPPTGVTGVVIANEFLDNVPCDVVELVDDGSVRQILVDPTTGEENLGPALDDRDRAWVDRWWPLHEPGDRAETGSTRDQAWSQIVGGLSAGLALAIDYGHQLDVRRSGSLPAGTLTGYRDGHQVVPVPDGSCDITAHVAVDSCYQAGIDAGADASALVTQSDALRALGLDAKRPALDLAHSDPQGYVERLSHASLAAELLDPASLGSFWWLLQAKGCRPVIDSIAWA
jgi:SAM-dependent MidA family methyltransferase